MTKDTKEIVNRHAERLKNTHQPRPPEERDKKWFESIKHDNNENKQFLTPHRITNENGDELLESIVNYNNIVNIIRDLKTNTAAGDDGIDNKTIKQLPKNALELLTIIFDISIQVGFFPSPWKRARVKMVLKAGKKSDDSANYRPISLLSCVGKLLEKLLKQSIDLADKANAIIPELHAGFRPKRSTQECFTRLGEQMVSVRKTKRVAATAFVDLEKCFDRLDHDVLKYRLRQLPLPSKTTRTIASFVTNRRLYVEENGIMSEEVTMASGAPQGAILSPTLYILYTHDAPLINDDDEGSSLYADDTALWTIGNNAREAVALLQRRLSILEDWCRRWRLHPAPTKTDIVAFSNSKTTSRQSGRDFDGKNDLMEIRC